MVIVYTLVILFKSTSDDANMLMVDQSTVQAALTFTLKRGQSSCTFTAKTVDHRRKWVNAIKLAK